MTRMASPLRRLRRERDLTQGQLAQLIGVSVSTICGLEKGHSQPSYETAVKLADLFGVDPRDLFPRPTQGTTEVAL